MGKTKTAFVGGVSEEGKKDSKQAYKEKKARQLVQKQGAEKIHISGLKGGERVKIVTADEPQVSEATLTEEKAKKIISKKNRGKKYLEAKTGLDKTKQYSLIDAISAVKKVQYSKFDETLELHLILKKTPTSAQATLPHSFGKGKKIEVADEKTIEKLSKGKVDFDVLLTTPEFMPKLVPFARILGPKGLMPNPKNNTIIKTKKDADKFSQNTLNLKTEKEAPLIHTSFGKISMEDKKLAENAQTILSALGGSKQIIKAYLKSTMSPSIKIVV